MPTSAFAARAMQDNRVETQPGDAEATTTMIRKLKSGKYPALFRRKLIRRPASARTSARSRPAAAAEHERAVQIF